MASAAELALIIKAKDEASGVFDSIKGGMASLGTAIGGSLLAGGVAAAAGALKIGVAFDDSFDAIAVKTGATGQQLDKLKQQFRDVVGSTPTDFATAADAVGVFGQRLDIVGDVGALSSQIANLAHMTGIDAAGAAKTATDTFAKFGVAAADQGPLLDKLFAASQASGVGFDVLSQNLSDFAPQLKAMGLDAESSTNLLWNLGAAGINAGEVMPGLTKAMSAAAKEGKSGSAALSDYVQKIQAAGSSSAAQKIAVDAFGKSGLKMADAIRSGALSLDDLKGSLATNAGAINKAAADTADFGEKWTMFKNKAAVALEPLGSMAMSAMGKVVDAMTPFLGVASDIAARVGKLVEGWQSADEWSSSLAETVTTLASQFLGLGDNGLRPVGEAIDAVVVAVQPFIDAAEAMGKKFLDFVGGPGPLMSSMLGVVLVAALGALAVAAWSAAAGVIAALAPILIPIALVGVAVAVLRKAWDKDWGGIREKVAFVVDWINTNVVPVLAGVWQKLQDGFAALVTWWKTNGDTVLSYLNGLWTAIAGVFQVGWDVIKGIFDIGVALFTGDFTTLGPKLHDLALDIVDGIGKALGGLWTAAKAAFTLFKDNAIPFLLEAGKKIATGLGDGLVFIITELPTRMGSLLVGVGSAIVAGLKKGVEDAWGGFMSFITGKASEPEAAMRKATKTESPSRSFADVARDWVAGLAEGLRGLGGVAQIIQDGLGKLVRQMDVENFELIQRLTSSLLGIFKDTADGIRALLSFDVAASAGQIESAFDRLVGVFQSAVKRMRELATFAGRGTQPGQGDHLNMDDIANIERFTGAIKATLDVASGTTDLLDKLSKVVMPAAGTIHALVPFLNEIRDAAKAFTGDLGADEDARDAFDRGAGIAASVAAFAKSVADLTSIKFAEVSASFLAQLQAAATIAGQALGEVRRLATYWSNENGDGMTAVLRDKVVTGIKSYAEAAGAAIGMLGAAAGLKIDAATLATTAQIGAAGNAANAALVKVAELAAFWIKWPAEFRGKILAGIKDYADAAGAAVGLLNTAAGLDLSKAVRATLDQMTVAGDNARLAEVILRGLADTYINAGALWRERVVPAMKDYADSAGAALKLLAEAAGITVDWSKVSHISLDALSIVSTNAENARLIVQQIAEFWRGTLDDKGMTELAATIKTYADTAGAALKMLADAAGIGVDWAKVSLVQVSSLVLAAVNAKNALFIVQSMAKDWAAGLDDKGMAAIVGSVKAWTDGAGAALKLLADAAGITTDWARVSLIQVSSLVLAGVNAKNALFVVQTLARDWAALLDEKGMAQVVSQIKAWGDAVGSAVKAFADSASALANLADTKIVAIPLAAIETAKGNMRLVLSAVGDLMTGPGGITAEVASLRATVAKSAGDAADGLSSVLDLILSAADSPFSKIRAVDNGAGSRGNTLRQNLANRLKSTLKFSVQALQDAIKEIPAITIPDGIAAAMKNLADAFTPIVELLDKLKDVGVDLAKVKALAAAPAILAAGLALGGGGVGAGGAASTGSGTGAPGGPAGAAGGKVVTYNQYGNINVLDATDAPDEFVDAIHDLVAMLAAP